MQIASEIDFEAAGLLFSPVLISVAAVIWLLMASGTIGRVVRFFEELLYRRAAVARLHPPKARADTVEGVASAAAPTSVGAVRLG